MRQNSLLFLACIIATFLMGAFAGYAGGNASDSWKLEPSAVRSEIELQSLKVLVSSQEDELNVYRRRCADWAFYVWRLENAGVTNFDTTEIK